MYSSIQQLKEQGFSKRMVSKYLEISRVTVRKYWDMSPDEYIKAAENIRKSHALEAQGEGSPVQCPEKYKDLT